MMPSSDAMKQYIQTIDRIRDTENMDPKITRSVVFAVMEIESGFRETVHSTDGLGSIGLMQVLPSTAREMGVYGPQSDPDLSILAGMRYLSACARVLKLNDMFTVHGMVQAYNVGAAGYVRGRRNGVYLRKFLRAHDRWLYLDDLR